MNTKLGLLKQAALAVCLAVGGLGVMPLAHADSFGISYSNAPYYAPAPRRCWYDYYGYYHCRPYYNYGYYNGPYYGGPYYGGYYPGVSFSYFGGFRDRDDFRFRDRDDWRWRRH
jgi:hypothetical protein